jgi:energy-coupling factor transport system ATP-binding protein
MTIQVENLGYIYKSPFAQDKLALSNVSLCIESNEMIAIIGSLGSGKTTLVQHFNGLLKPTFGRIFVDSIDLADSKTKLMQIRRKVGLVFQFPEIQFFEETVYDEIAFGPKNLGLSNSQIEERVKQSMQMVGLQYEAFQKRSPFQLSGGEKRRVAIAGILANDPQILILDEPTVGLDKAGTDLIEKVIRTYHRNNKTVIFISHDIDLVARLASRIIVLNSGKIVFDGCRDVLFKNPSILKQTGFNRPRISEFMEKIKKAGYFLNTTLYTIKDAKRELKNYHPVNRDNVA